MTIATVSPTVLARPSGGYAMLAIDQREALRAMFAAKQSEPVTDGQITDFKVAAARTLSPYASAILVDKQFAWDAVIAANAVDPGCALIAAADHFTGSATEFVADVAIDDDVDPATVRAQGARALKLLVLWRPDEDPAGRIALVTDFVQRCRTNGLVSIIEPVSRGPRDGGAFDHDAGIFAAAEELGTLGADLYKAEVPTAGQGTDEEIRTGCAKLTEAVTGPWVVLSSGVPAERFPDAVRLACQAGASGFLAGRAIWASVVGSPTMADDLRTVSVDRLRRLCDVVDDAVSR
ncbi:sulfofructosephosphate aldolase [Micromonospora pallida]|uniref:Sulfofructosephosphate aldolase n=1 Tax=Micromonospora pallida TaxID=145854 RepID=A0A1C6SSM3_9ACTN|nr:aldolase [Micromonospora pallida]SCL32457.1 sulfofructosephosphate aldolase [Micromonospora pallida]